MEAIKISSGDLTNGPLLLAAARTRIPLILSTGMATEAEISDALGLVAFALGGAAKPPSRTAFSAAWENAAQREAARKQVTLLQCTSQYPAPVGDSNLRAMATLREKFGVLVGLSDHTEGVAIGLAAAALGACMIEKHFTLDRAATGPDHRASLDPDALAQLVRGVREVESALGDGIKQPRPSEIDVQAVARRSLVAAREIRKGEVFTEDNVTAKRPASGRSPMDIWDVLGTFARRDFRPDDFIP
jgi:N-acetylneuraminate synthase